MRTYEEIRHAFAYHKPGSVEVVDLHGYVRSACRDLAEDIFKYVPESAERTLALRKVREAMFYANAAIALHHPDNVNGGGDGGS